MDIFANLLSGGIVPIMPPSEVELLFVAHPAPKMTPQMQNSKTSLCIVILMFTVSLQVLNPAFGTFTLLPVSIAV